MKALGLEVFGFVAMVTAVTVMALTTDTDGCQASTIHFTCTCYHAAQHLHSKHTPIVLGLFCLDRVILKPAHLHVHVTG